MQRTIPVLSGGLGRALSVLFMATLVAAACFGLAVKAHAQGAGDPPSRVAALNYFEGAVSFTPAGSGEWAYAEFNRPMTSGDRLWVDRGARAELHMGSTALRLGGESSLAIATLGDTAAQFT
ncbi:MAG TPA: hypothetical protein VN667_21640, partial [Burkholderiales bacterium]|nr:hypothetical protein [Burkholderiales bacterium]